MPTLSVNRLRVGQLAGVRFKETIGKAVITDNGVGENARPDNFNLLKLALILGGVLDTVWVESPTILKGSRVSPPPRLGCIRLYIVYLKR